MTSDDNQLVDLMNGALGSTIPTAKNMGVRVVEAHRGFAAATVPVEGNGNHFGVVYRYFPLVENVDIAFVGMARPELRAEVRSRLMPGAAASSPAG